MYTRGFYEDGDGLRCGNRGDGERLRCWNGDVRGRGTRGFADDFCARDAAGGLVRVPARRGAVALNDAVWNHDVFFLLNFDETHCDRSCCLVSGSCVVDHGDAIGL